MTYTSNKPETWAIVGEDGREYSAPLGEPITAPRPGFYTIRYPQKDASELPMVMVIPRDDSIEWCSAELAMADAEQVYDIIVEQIEVERGFVQGGFVQRMAAKDVVPGSPLAKALLR